MRHADVSRLPVATDFSRYACETRRLRDLRCAPTRGPVLQADTGPADLHRDVSVARILLIDDSPVVLDAVAELLESRGYEVVTAERAEIGLEVLGTGQFTVVVTDVCMPGMDGLAML